VSHTVAPRSGRRGWPGGPARQFARLVDDFVATVDERGGRVNPTMIAEEP
jgi:hypothetical protein